MEIKFKTRPPDSSTDIPSKITRKGTTISGESKL